MPGSTSHSSGTVADQAVAMLFAALATCVLASSHASAGGTEAAYGDSPPRIDPALRYSPWPMSPAGTIRSDVLDGSVAFVAGAATVALAVGGAVIRLRRSDRAARLLTVQLAAANQTLSRSNEDLDEFAQLASHDLQEPLRKLIAYSELLRDDLGEDLPPEAAEDLGYIVDAARRMQALVQDVLTLSRTGRKVMNAREVDLEHVADEALARLSTRIDESSAIVTRDPLPVVVGDRGVIVALYQNLVANALKFVDRHPPRVHLSCGTIGRESVLGVRDEGIGIDPDYVEQIFHAFRRLHSRSAYAGTGIGLAICRKAVERHGGRIWVESRPGVGSHFKFTLPGPATSEVRKDGTDGG